MSLGCMFIFLYLISLLSSTKKKYNQCLLFFFSSASDISSFIPTYWDRPLNNDIIIVLATGFIFIIIFKHRKYYTTSRRTPHNIFIFIEFLCFYYYQPEQWNLLADWKYRMYSVLKFFMLAKKNRSRRFVD